MYTPAPTTAVYSNGVPLDPATLSTPAQAAQILALLNATPGFVGAATVDPPHTTENGAVDGNKIDWKTEPQPPAPNARQFLTICNGAINVGDLIDKMGGIGSAGTFTCIGVGSPTSPIWVPAQVAAPVVHPAAPLVAGAGYQIIHTMFGDMIEPIPVMPTPASESGGLTTAQAATLAELTADLPRLEALMAQFGH